MKTISKWNSVAYTAGMCCRELGWEVFPWSLFPVPSRPRKAGTFGNGWILPQKKGWRCAGGKILQSAGCSPTSAWNPAWGGAARRGWKIEVLGWEGDAGWRIRIKDAGWRMQDGPAPLPWVLVLKGGCRMKLHLCRGCCWLWLLWGFVLPWFGAGEAPGAGAGPSPPILGIFLCESLWLHHSTLLPRLHSSKFK